MSELDTAHRLSLIQRNLEAAQLNLDSATELLTIVLQNGLEGEMESRPPATRKAAKKEPRKKVGPTALIEEFVAGHPGEFGYDDLAKWAKAKGYSHNKGSVMQALYVMSKRKAGITTLEKGSGRYKRVA